MINQENIHNFRRLFIINRICKDSLSLDQYIKKLLLSEEPYHRFLALCLRSYCNIMCSEGKLDVRSPPPGRHYICVIDTDNVGPTDSQAPTVERSSVPTQRIAPWAKHLDEASSHGATDTNSTDGPPDTADKISPSILHQGAKTVATAAAHAIDNTFKKPVTTILGLEDGSDCVEPPLECPNENITFWYYPRPEVSHPVRISVSEPRTLENVERNDRSWKVIIHGYTKSKDDIPNPELLAAYRTQGRGHNILSVDYGPIARTKCYVQAVSNVPLISKCTAQILDELIDRGYMKLENLHVIGFSLGGQISGQIHEYLRNGRPPRVTALDPASPLFDGKINAKVGHSAADFVDVIHTNTMAFGMPDPSGHIDFYINTGVVQPGCIKKDNESLTTCSHDRAPLVYAESINSQIGFWGVPCSSGLKYYAGRCNTVEENLVIMGEYTPPTARGIYYVQTRDQPPYALGKVTKAFVDL